MDPTAFFDQIKAEAANGSKRDRAALSTELFQGLLLVAQEQDALGISDLVQVAGLTALMARTAADAEEIRELREEVKALRAVIGEPK